jgi:hypothetical protein
MPAIETRETNELPLLARPEVGMVLTLMSGLAFLVLAMTLPLVGKAAKAVVHYRENFITFSAILAVATVLAGLAVFSKLERRKIDRSPLPILSMFMLGLCLMLALALFTGLLAI